MADYEVRNILSYTKEDTWAREMADGNIRGHYRLRQKMLKEIVFVNLPQVGDAVKAMEPLGSIESVKAEVDVICPVSGTVAAINGLLDDPSILNSDPYEAGWLIDVDPSDAADMAKLLSAEEYRPFWQKKHNNSR